MLFVAVLASSPAAQQQTTGGSPERDFLSRVRRLTVEGRRAGEGYWSPDGKRLVFQSEREPGNPFYQIYVLDLDDRRHEAHLARHRQDDLRVLPARTATRSCSPRRTTIRSRSSCQDEELAFRASGKERRYSWDYDPEMEIYAVQREDRRAEAADQRARLRRRGQLLARRPVDRVLVDARRLRPHADRRRDRSSSRSIPSYFAEIYIMRADGSGQRRLTNVPGYDGGPFFTPDGTRIIWRRFDEQRADRRRLDDEARRHRRSSRSPTSAR